MRFGSWSPPTLCWRDTGERRDDSLSARALTIEPGRTSASCQANRCVRPRLGLRDQATVSCIVTRRSWRWNTRPVYLRAVVAPARSRSLVAPLPDSRIPLVFLPDTRMAPLPDSHMGLVAFGIGMKPAPADTERLRSQDAAALRYYRPGNHWDKENRGNPSNYWDKKNRDTLHSHHHRDSGRDRARGSGVPSSPNAAQLQGRAV
jgi:hypothetical protein